MAESEKAKAWEATEPANSHCWAPTPPAELASLFGLALNCLCVEEQLAPALPWPKSRGDDDCGKQSRLLAETVAAEAAQQQRANEVVTLYARRGLLKIA